MTLNIERSMGKVEHQFTEFLAQNDGLIIIKTQSDDRQSVKDSVVSFIQRFGLTASQFREMKIVKETFVSKSIEQGILQNREGFDLGALFRILTQGDQSVFNRQESSAGATDTKTMPLD